MSAVEIFPETEIEVRDALPDDAHAISAIYAWHVLHGRASFEEIPPTVDEMRQRMKSVTDSGLPWLVALYRGIVVGYCYATFYRPRQPTGTPLRNPSMWMPALPGAGLARPYSRH